MTKKQHLLLNLKHLISDREEICALNESRVRKIPLFSDVILAIVDLEIKKLDKEILKIPL